MITRLWLAGVLLAGLAAPAYCQAVRVGTPYNAQLRTDPDVGNVQGIQRYGRPLKTDPDQGEGYSYHVYPVANPSNVAVGQVAGQAPGAPQPAPPVPQQAEPPHVKKLKDKADEDYQKAIRETDAAKSKQLRVAALESWRAYIAAAQPPMVAAAPGAVSSVVAFGTPAPASPYPPPFVATQGFRSPRPSAVFAAPAVAPTVVGPAPAGIAVMQPGVMPLVAANVTPPTQQQVQLLNAWFPIHEPLIQVRVRVVEVDRSNMLNVSSVLDFVGTPGGPTRITANNVNNNMRNISGATRFPGPLTLSATNLTLGGLSGVGGLVNLTTGNMNWILQFLQTELRADLITAPQVVTLNGQNVEFVAGQRVPFALGQNVIQGTNNNIQQYFYKHVGTYISVTPQIVNWGTSVYDTNPAYQTDPTGKLPLPNLFGAYGGKSPVMYSEIADWNHLVHFLLAVEPTTNLIKNAKSLTLQQLNDIDGGGQPVPLVLRQALLSEINRFDRDDLIRLGMPLAARPGCNPCPGGRGTGCAWHPEDCTIGLEIVVRLSDAASFTFGGTASGTTMTTGTNGTATTVTAEDNVRAIANVIQVKSGHGVIMGGLINESDVRDVTKVPVLGDIPVIGALFRSFSTTRVKTEILLFIEAEVLDPCPPAARAQSARDFRFSWPYVAGDFLNNPLELGMYRAGFGPYLPPHSPQERVFWERLGRQVRTIATTVDDIFQ